MKHIKIYEQFNLDDFSDEELFGNDDNYFPKENIEKYYYDYKELFNHTKYDEEYGYTNYELWTEVGQLTLKYNLTRDDVKWILDNKNTRFDSDKFLEDTYLHWDD